MSIHQKVAIVGIAHLPFSKIGTPERTNAMRVTTMELEDAGRAAEPADVA